MSRLAELSESPPSPTASGASEEARPGLGRGRIPLLALKSATLEALARERIGSGAGIWRQVYREALLEGRFEPERHGISARAARAWRETFRLDLPEVRAKVDEPSLHPVDPRETVKVALQASDGLEMECVRIPMSKGRNTLCLSSQVGCRLACRFCETGRLGLLRNLEPEEIVAQVVVAQSVLEWPIRNLVFMGMGEPLDNAENLVTALGVLTDPRGLAFGQQRITVCTAGVPAGLEILARLGFRRMGLSFSLNAATDEKRNRLMPINRRHPLSDVQDALRRYPKREGFVLALNYCLLPGFNDGREDAEAVARFARPLGRALVNVIPYNPGTHPLTRAPSRDEVERFVGWLMEEGVAVRERRTKGRTVMAACGQLGNLELRTRQRAARSKLPLLEGT